MRPSGWRQGWGASGKLGCVGRQGGALGAHLEAGTDERWDKEDGNRGRNRQDREHAGHTRALRLRHERRMGRMGGGEEERAMRKRLSGVLVLPASPEKREQGDENDQPAGKDTHVHHSRSEENTSELQAL